MNKLGMVILAAFMIIGCGSREAKEGFQGVTAKQNFIKAGEQYLKEGKVVKAVQSFDRAIQQDPKDLTSYMILSQVYLHLKNYPRAVDTLSAATRVAPDSGEVYYLLAFSQALAGKRDAALMSAKRSALIFQKKNEAERMKKALILVKSLEQPVAAAVPTTSDATATMPATTDAAK